jgi:hypothetical protein
MFGCGLLVTERRSSLSDATSEVALGICGISVVPSVQVLGSPLILAAD